jgi:putative endonuclease
MTNRKNGVLYIGVTSNLKKRVYEHKTHMIKGFTNKYHLNKIVHFEKFLNIRSAILREKQLKKWNRKWKIHLIERTNVEWEDLYKEIIS